MNTEKAKKVREILERLESIETVYAKATTIKSSVHSGNFDIVYDNENRLLLLLDATGNKFKISVKRLIEYLSSLENELWREKEKVLKELKSFG
jgi:hypothetical protein